MNCPNINCHYRNSDDLCFNLYDRCRLYNRYKIQKELDIQHEIEQRRYFEENDLGLLRLISPEQPEGAKNVVHTLPPSGDAFHKHTWNSGKVV